MFSGKPVFESTTPEGTPAAKPVQMSDEESGALSVLELDVASLRDTVRKLELENITLKHQIATLYRLTDNEIPQESANDHQTH